MKAILKPGLLVAAFLVFLNTPAFAQNITGTWRYLLMNVPGEMLFQGNTLVGGDEFEISNEQVQYVANGQELRFTNLFYTDERGPFSISEDLILEHQIVDGSYSMQMNQSHDIMIGGSALDNGEGGDIGYIGWSMALKPPGSFTVSQLAGQWDYRRIETPESVSVDNLTPGSPLSGGGNFWAESASRATINANGVLSHPDFGGTVGSFVVQQGQPVLVTGEGNDSFVINASLDVMVQLSSDTTDDDEPIHGVSLLIRRPDSLSTNDIVGLWHLSEFFVPSQLRVGGTTGNLNVDGSHQFENSSITLSFSANGMMQVVGENEK